MAKRKVKKEFEYAQVFDAAMEEQFGESFTTEWNIFAGTFGSYVTVRDNGKRLTKQMALYGRGLSNGIAAARAHFEEN